MWVLRLEKPFDKTVVCKFAVKYGVSFYGYPVSVKEQDGVLHVNVAGFVEGTTPEVKAFVEAIKKEAIVEHATANGPFVLARIKLNPLIADLYSSEIIFIKPAFYSKSGTERLELASWEKEPLMKIVAMFQKLTGCKVISFRQEKISNIGLISVHPELTDKQRRAMQLAVANGYYEFPRKITLEKLAKIMGVSFSTYQAHLAKAESRFIPAMAGKFL